MPRKNIIINGDVQIGERVEIGPFAVLTGPCVIEDDAYVGAHACIGAPPQHHGSYPAPLNGAKRGAGVRIARGACVREYATLHQGIVRETLVDRDAVVMAYSHISHDSIVGEASTLSTNTVLGGFTLIAEHVTTGQGVVTHPWIILGEGAMVGLNSSVVKNVLPFAKVAGAPARLLGTNTHKAPGLPAEYSETILSSEVWDAYALLEAQQAQAREAWGRVE